VAGTIRSIFPRRTALSFFASLHSSCVIVKPFQQDSSFTIQKFSNSEITEEQHIDHGPIHGGEKAANSSHSNKPNEEERIWVSDCDVPASGLLGF
jgi:hypothetical protein